MTANSLSKKISRILYHVIGLLVSLSILGCQGSIGSQIFVNSYPMEERNYKTAGFNSAGEVLDYAEYYTYFASKISGPEWESFYTQFPEYFMDMQTCKRMTFYGDYSPGYTVYAFRWLTFKKKKAWDEKTIKRLENGTLLEGDDIFKVIYSMGLQKRLIWDNDFEILFYKNRAVMLEKGLYSKTLKCDNCDKCWIEKKVTELQKKVCEVQDHKVMEILSLKRPTY